MLRILERELSRVDGRINCLKKSIVDLDDRLDRLERIVLVKEYIPKVVETTDEVLEHVVEILDDERVLYEEGFVGGLRRIWRLMIGRR